MKGLIFLLLFALTTSFVSADLLKVDPGATAVVSQQVIADNFLPQAASAEGFTITATGWFTIVALVMAPTIFFKARRLKRTKSPLLKQRSFSLSNLMSRLKTVLEANRAKSDLLRSRLQTA